MANSEHLEILAQGKETWNQWRRDNPDVTPDLSFAKFENHDDTQWDFSGFNLSRANLTEAEFHDCKFVETDLSQTIFANVNILLCDFIKSDFSRALIVTDKKTLCGPTNFVGVNFSDAMLANAAFRMIRFDNINFFGAKFQACLFHESELSDCDLRDSDWRGAKFTASKLANCKLDGAKFNGMSFYVTSFISSNLTDTSLAGAIFSMMDLAGYDFSGRDLSDCRFDPYCTLDKATFRNTNLNGARFAESSLKAVDFTDANLSNAEFVELSLQEVDFTGANLSNAEFIDTDFDEANLHNAVLSQTLLAGVNLSKSLGLETCQHIGPSKIDIRTLELSGELPLEFLRGVGLSDTLITYHRSLFLEEPIQFYSCFISFTEADDELAQRLYNDLQGAGVRCWRWKEDAKWGRSLMGEIDTAVRNYDKLVVICSQHSLKSHPVIREIERALQREDQLFREGLKAEVLFPIAIDDSIFSWNHARKPDVVDKAIGNFKNWRNHDHYMKLFDRLLTSLKPD